MGGENGKERENDKPQLKIQAVMQSLADQESECPCHRQLHLGRPLLDRR